MLHGEPEHDEGQRRLGQAVMLVKVMLHGLGQQVGVNLKIHMIIVIVISMIGCTSGRDTCSLQKTVTVSVHHSPRRIPRACGERGFWPNPL